MKYPGNERVMRTEMAVPEFGCAKTPDKPIQKEMAKQKYETGKGDNL